MSVVCLISERQLVSCESAPHLTICAVGVCPASVLSSIILFGFVLSTFVEVDLFIISSWTFVGLVVCHICCKDLMCGAHLFAPEQPGLFVSVDMMRYDCNRGFTYSHTRGIGPIILVPDWLRRSRVKVFVSLCSNSTGRCVRSSKRIGTETFMKNDGERNIE